MSSIRTHRKVALALASLAVAAGGVLLWWAVFSGGQGGPYISAAGEVIRDACADNDKVEHYDITTIGIHIRGGETVRFTQETRVGGKFFQQVNSDEDGNARAEWIVGEGHTYLRERSEAGEWGDWTVGQLPKLSPTQAPDPNIVLFCGFTVSEYDVTFVGNEVLNGVEVGRYRVSDPGWEAIGGHERFDYWVDTDGQVRQTVHDFYDPEEGGSEERVTTTTTFSGLGEPNEITAPVQ